MGNYTRDLAAQCAEMNFEATLPKPAGDGIGIPDCPPDVDENWLLPQQRASNLRESNEPLRELPWPLTNHAVCNLTLGGSVSSRCVALRLKRASNDGGQFKLVEPGDPDKSWLYLKASGEAETAGCISSDVNQPCNATTMPPGGKTMTASELEILRKWIADGANYP